MQFEFTFFKKAFTQVISFLMQWLRTFKDATIIFVIPLLFPSLKLVCDFVRTILNTQYPIMLYGTCIW